MLQFFKWNFENLFLCVYRYKFWTMFGWNYFDHFRIFLYKFDREEGGEFLEF